MFLVYITKRMIGLKKLLSKIQLTAVYTTHTHTKTKNSGLLFNGKQRPIQQNEVIIATVCFEMKLITSLIQHRFVGIQN